MPKFEDGAIYEYIEKLFYELTHEDGGYFPSKHDQKVFFKTSEKFNKPIEEVIRIFDEFSGLAAKKEILKLNSLPKNKREARRMEMLTNILKNNRDLPYYDIEGPASEPISSGMEIIRDEYKEIAEYIGKNGWTIPMGMGLSELEGLMPKDRNIEAYDLFFSQYYSNKRFKLMIKHINQSSITKSHKELFNDCIQNYDEKRYLTCITVLLTLLEGVLSSFGDTKKDIRVIRICRFHMDALKITRS
jgi:hypothetical protein